jgi:hypothetical protein
MRSGISIGPSALCNGARPPEIADAIQGSIDRVLRRGRHASSLDLLDD